MQLGVQTTANNVCDLNSTSELLIDSYNAALLKMKATPLRAEELFGRKLLLGSDIMGNFKRETIGSSHVMFDVWHWPKTWDKNSFVFY